MYKAQYGVHIDPRTAYQHCQELRYEQFKSVQGLMNAMREYQRMASTMLTDAVLESILWNKVPVSLQQEVKELTVGNVQVLLQKLLRAESVVQERSRRLSQEQKRGTSGPRRARDHSNEQNDSTPSRTVGVDADCNEKAVTRRSETNAEMGQKKVKCFRCSKTGHIVKNCPLVKRELPTHRVTTGKDNQRADPWVLSVTADDSGTYNVH